MINDRDIGQRSNSEYGFNSLMILWIFLAKRSEELHKLLKIQLEMKEIKIVTQVDGHLVNCIKTVQLNSIKCYLSPKLFFK